MSIDEPAHWGSGESVNRAATEVPAMKATAEEPSTRLAGLGAESMSQCMSEVAGQLDTEHQTLTGVTDGLERSQASGGFAAALIVPEAGTQTGGIRGESNSEQVFRCCATPRCV